MSRISMDSANKIAANEALKKFDKKISDAEYAFKKLLTDKVKEKYPIPKSVQKVLSEESGWIRHEDDVRCKFGDNRYECSYALTDSIAIQIHGSFQLDPTDDIKNAYQEWKDLEAAKKKFKREVESIILSLGTPKRVVEQVPELKGYFENQLVKSTAMVPVEQIKKVRAQLASK